MTFLRPNGLQTAGADAALTPEMGNSTTVLDFQAAQPFPLVPWRRRSANRKKPGLESPGLLSCRETNRQRR
ncbi:MAG: hypothetical protein ACLPLR_03655 [Terriglobales bacterium]